MTGEDRVCPECGEVSGPGIFCISCGTNLSSVAGLPTRAEWLELQISEEHPPSTDTVQVTSPPGPLNHPYPPAPLHADPIEPPQPAVQPKPFMPSQPAKPSAAAAALAALPPAPKHEDRAFWGYRTGAWLLQLGIVGTVAGVLMYVVAESGIDTEDGGSWVGFVIVGLLFCITVGFHAVFPGQTLGMRVAGIQVVRENGAPMSAGYAFVRYVLCGAIYLFPLVSVAEWLTPLGNERRSLRDRIAKTYVIKLEPYRSRRWALTAASLTAILIYGASVTLGQEAVERQDRTLFISGCVEDGDASTAECDCRYDELTASLTDADNVEIAALEDGEDLPWSIQSKVEDSVTECE